MSRRILLEQLNGETLELEVTAEMTMRDVKEQVKRMHEWEDELSRDTTVVDLIMGDKKVMNEETVEELGLCDGLKVTVVFRKNVVKCTDGSDLSPDRDPEALVIVEIPDSETEIKARAFLECWQVAKVIIPSSVTRIREGAFRDCISLVTISIPDSVAFQYCMRVAKVIIPSSGSDIGFEAFRGCSSLVSVDIPDSVTQISRGAFRGCTSLVTIIPDSIRSIGDEAFADCSSLVTINIPDSVTEIGGGAFRNCGSLTRVDIPHSVTAIGKDAFTGCNRLTLTAPARLLSSDMGAGCKQVAKECGCGRCDWRWFHKGWVCGGGQ